MKTEELDVDAAGSQDHKFWYRVGSIAAIVLGIGYIVIIPLYAHVGAAPSGAEAWFNYLPGKTTIWWAILALSVFTDFLYVPIALVLYLALEKVNRGAMLLAAAFIGLFVALDVAITWSHYASMLVLYGQYSTAMTDLQRAGYLAAANYGAAVLASRLEVVIAIVTPSIGVLVTGLVMLRGVFDKFTAWLAVVVGVFGIASLTGLGVAIYGNAILFTVWLFFVAYRLYRLAQD
ncbi:MAG: hypothetical protein ABSC88_05085 [Terracidiphilus sp.]|jgi:hypothetical protein